METRLGDGPLGLSVGDTIDHIHDGGKDHFLGRVCELRERAKLKHSNTRFSLLRGRSRSQLLQVHASVTSPPSWAGKPGTENQTNPSFGHILSLQQDMKLTQTRDKLKQRPAGELTRCSLPLQT